ncbi:sterol desaturase family protein [Alsobacter sp. R-9]
MSIEDLFGFRSLLLVALIFIPLEHLLPAHGGRKLPRAGTVTDLAHVVISGFFIRVGLMGLIVIAVQAGTLAVPGAVRDGIASWPLLVQVVVATVIADLGFYVAHRIMHAVPALWHFHAVHHSSEQLDWLAASRVHPVDQVFTKGLSLGPVFVLGFSDTALAITGVIYFWQSVVVHANVRLPVGPLRWIIATPEFHHWHHANHPEAYDKNFSGQLPLWDIVFGTAHMPGGMPTRYGVDDPIPLGYASQIAYPFRKLFAALSTRKPDSNTSHGTAAPSGPPAEQRADSVTE